MGGGGSSYGIMSVRRGPFIAPFILHDLHFPLIIPPPPSPPFKKLHAGDSACGRRVFKDRGGGALISPPPVLLLSAAIELVVGAFSPFRHHALDGLARRCEALGRLGR